MVVTGEDSSPEEARLDPSDERKRMGFLADLNQWWVTTMSGAEVIKKSQETWDWEWGATH